MNRPWFSLWTLLSLLLNLIAPLGVSAALGRTEYGVRPPPLLVRRRAGRTEYGVRPPPLLVRRRAAARNTEYALLPSWFAAAPAARNTEYALLPSWFAAAPAARNTEYALLPSWFAAAPAARNTEHALLPSWFASAPATRNTEYALLPSWFASAPATRNTEHETLPLPADHHTIHDVTITGPDGPINNCDVVTFTIVAANDAVTTTGVIITSTMPAGFEPTQVVFNVGTVGPNETITRHAVFSATCSAVSGQNVVTLTQDGYPPIVRYTDFVVNPGAITVRKAPAVIKAAPATW